MDSTVQKKFEAQGWKIENFPLNDSYMFLYERTPQTHEGIFPRITLCSIVCFCCSSLSF
jgi:hypothetical protein